MSLRFEWHWRKAETNEKKHGVRFEEAATVFDDPLARIFADESNSTPEETREILIGYSSEDRLVLVIFTEPEPDLVRIISAREATRKERRDYEENT